MVCAFVLYFFFLGELRRTTIADREDEYRSRRRLAMISPARVDPFADGTSAALLFVYTLV